MQKTVSRFLVTVLLLPFFIFSAHSIELEVNNQLTNRKLDVFSWVDDRDDRITKQGFDYSCGASSLATILKEYYGLDVVEADIIDVYAKISPDIREASFDIMAKSLTSFGFKGIGVATTWEQLTKLEIPVIVYVKQRKQDHFTVIRGIDEKTVQLADSIRGNITMTRGQFKSIWEKREGKHKGKLLAILPLEKTEVEINADFFNKSPNTPSKISFNLVRTFPRF